MGGNEAQFIVKATLLFKACPAPSCPGPNGGHSKQDLPCHCLVWWRETGWQLMGWKGSRETAGSADIMKKINNFRKVFNLRRKNLQEQASDPQPQESQYSQIQNTQVCNEIKNSRERLGLLRQGAIWHCQFCSYQGNFSLHLRQEEPCLTAYLQEYLSNRAHKYRGRMRLAIFDVGLVCNFCPNPDCAINLQGKGVTCLIHVTSLCKEFYQSEGEHLLQWEQGLRAAEIQCKLNNRKGWVTRNLTEASQTQVFHEELSKVLKFVCQKCAIQGPLLDHQEYRIFVPPNLGQPQLAECFLCMNNGSVGQELVQEAVEALGELGSPAEHDDTLKLVVIEDKSSEDQRVVFVPAVFQVECQSVNVSDYQINPLSVTVLVPKNPEALEAIGDEASERANVAKERLEKTAEFFGRRRFLGPVTETLSVLFRHKLGQIRREQLAKLGSQRLTGKGTVISRNPNIAAVKARKPHFAETKKFCLSNTSWSATAQEKRAKESKARLYINGKVRINVRITLIKKMATDSPLLGEVIQQASSFGPTPLASLAPLVLNYVKAKTKLLVKHIISPTYTNWDLDVRFANREWTVEMVGFLYCEELEELNKRIARGEVSENEMAEEVRRYLHVLPTAAVTHSNLTRDHNIEEGRARVIEALVQRHQMEGEPKPLSLLTIYTPTDVEVSEEEQFLRGRAIQLGKAMSQGMDGVRAIAEIMGVLNSEGISGIVRFPLVDGRRIRDDLRPFFTHESSTNEDLLLYHILLFKTGGRGKWTMARDPGATQTDSYLPDLLDASGLHMSAEISLWDGDLQMPGEGYVSEELKRHLLTQESLDDGESEGQIPNIEDWKEVSLLEFVNATLPADKVGQARGSSSQTIVPIVTSKDRKLTWRKAVDCDNHSGNHVFQVEEGESTYVRTNTDARVLYEKRPKTEGMDEMCLGQFATEYILLQSSRKGFEKAMSSINEDTQVGADSQSLVAGTDFAAPETLKLSDGKLMKRRQGGKAVPLLLHSGTASRHGNQLLFSPWRQLEEVTGAQEEEETGDQKKRRLEIFPCSMIPFDEEGSEDDSE